MADSQVEISTPRKILNVSEALVKNFNILQRTGQAIIIPDRWEM